jgi:hypothetical protein
MTAQTAVRVDTPTRGNDGRSLISGTGAPTADTGRIGDIYVDKLNKQLYGPKTGAGWGAASSLGGDKGWSPEFSVATDSARRVLRVAGWQGGDGTEPASGQYVGATGLVSDIADAVDIRGPEGVADLPVESSTYVGDAGAVTVDTTDEVTRVHDGTTPGGVPGARRDRVGFHVPTLTGAGSVDIPDDVGSFRTAGYSAVGSGGALYVEQESEPLEVGTASLAKAYISNKWWLWSDDFVMPEKFGGKGDDVDEDTAALMDCVDYINRQPGRGNLFLNPYSAGYRVADTLAFQGQRKSISTPGGSRGRLIHMEADAPIITIGDGSNNIRVANLRLEREVTATFGGDGVAVLGTTSNCLIDQVYAVEQYNGFLLHSTDIGFVTHCRAEECTNDGFRQVNIGIGLQWHLLGFNYALRCDANGFSIQNANPGDLIDSTGTVGRIVGGYTFQNGGYAVIVVGTGSVPLYNFSCIRGIFGDDTSGGVLLNSYGGHHDIRENFFEREEVGVEVTQNNQYVDISRNRIREMQSYGILVDALDAEVHGNTVYSCGQDTGLTSAERSGIRVNGNATAASLIGNSSINNGGHGVISQGTNVYLDSNDLRGNAGDPLNVAGGNVLLGTNAGVAARTRGSTTTTTDGSGNFVVAHGCLGTPTTVSAIAVGATPYIVNLTNISSTELTFRVSDAAGSPVASTSVTLSWQAASTYEI